MDNLMVKTSKDVNRIYSDDEYNNFITCLSVIMYPAYGTYNADDLVHLNSTALPNVILPFASRDRIPIVIFTLRILCYSIASKQRSSGPSWDHSPLRRPTKAKTLTPQAWRGVSWLFYCGTTICIQVTLDSRPASYGI
jgi:hypothetical protein